MAKLTLQAADLSYSANDQKTGDGFWDNAMALIDGAYDYSKQAFLKGVNTAGNFMAGVINGATGLPPRNSDLNDEDAFVYGKALGALIGLAGDAAAIIEGIGMMGGGGAITVISGGTLLPVGAAAGTGGAALAGAGASMAGVHYGELKDALDYIRLKKGESGGGGEWMPLTNSEARKAANQMGYKETRDISFDSHGKPVFKKGNRFITPDRDGHNGGVWKLFDKSGNRLGTYNHDLSVQIGD
jgi:hypothetical protein